MSKERYNGKLIDSKLLPQNESGYTACRWCKGDVIPPKRTMCSPECVHEILIRSNGTYLRKCVYDRDNGICAMCNIDTKLIAKTALSLSECEREEYLKEYSISPKRKIHKKRFGGGLWDADHIVMVKENGGKCGLDNLRTLCIKCHKLVTKTSYNKDKP